MLFRSIIVQNSVVFVSQALKCYERCNPVNVHVGLLFKHRLLLYFYFQVKSCWDLKFLNHVGYFVQFSNLVLSFRCISFGFTSKMSSKRLRPLKGMWI